ncbi:uncharacterized protein LOC119092655 [Pollicipes pollicipes]|uniref:uncharacterized protein LOC119092655 n=1 Tax=Pollicipes pollicipes TaxID=41117 RepID=UPI001884E42F|nr:uncharacterized protein LOC119092655 [Pollicipes pollicipes]
MAARGRPTPLCPLVAAAAALWLLVTPGHCLRCIQCVPTYTGTGYNELNWSLCERYQPGLPGFTTECNDTCIEELIYSPPDGEATPKASGLLRTCGDLVEVNGDRCQPLDDGKHLCSCTSDLCNVGLLPTQSAPAAAAVGGGPSWWWLMAVPGSLAAVMVLVLAVKVRRRRRANGRYETTADGLGRPRTV